MSHLRSLWQSLTQPWRPSKVRQLERLLQFFRTTLTCNILFLGGKKTKGAFIPGKGLHQNEPFENLLAASNPALATFKGGKNTKGAFIPGKGLHKVQPFNESA